MLYNRGRLNVPTIRLHKLETWPQVHRRSSSPSKVFQVRPMSSRSAQDLPGPAQVFQFRAGLPGPPQGLSGPPQVFHVRHTSARSAAGLPCMVQVRRWQLHLHVVSLSSRDSCDLVQPRGRGCAGPESCQAHNVAQRTTCYK